MKSKATVGHFFGTVGICLWCTLGSVLFLTWLHLTVPATSELSRNIQVGLHTALTVLLIFSTVRASTARRAAYQAAYAKGTLPWPVHIRTVLRTPTVYLDAVLLIPMLYIGIEVSPYHSYAPLLAYILPMHGAFPYLWITVITLPLYIIVFILAHMTVQGRMRAACPPTDERIVYRRRRGLPPPIRVALATVQPFGLLLICAMLLPLLSSVLALVAELVGRTTTVIVIAVLLLLLSTCRYLRAIRKRRGFERRLRAVVAERGGELIWHHGVCRSLFLPTEGADFTLYLGKDRYDGKFLHSLRRHTPMCFDGSGRVTLPRIYKIRGVELFSVIREQAYAFESEGRRLLVILPTPKQLLYLGGGARHTLDTGDTVGGYTIYTASGLLGAVERDTLRRREFIA